MFWIYIFQALPMIKGIVHHFVLLVFWIELGCGVADLGRNSKFVGLSFGHLITIRNMRFEREKKMVNNPFNSKYVFSFHGRSLSNFGEFSPNDGPPPVPFYVKVVNISTNKWVESEFMQLSWIPDNALQCNFQEPQSCNNNFRFQSLHALFKYGEKPNFSVKLRGQFIPHKWSLNIKIYDFSLEKISSPKYGNLCACLPIVASCRYALLEI